MPLGCMLSLRVLNGGMVEIARLLTFWSLVHGIYDVQANTGFMVEVIHHDTLAFAVDCIVK